MGPSTRSSPRRPTALRWFAAEAVRTGLRRRRWLAVPGAFIMLLVASGVAHARLSWSGPVARDTAGTGPALTSVACPSASECAAIDVGGGVVTFDPAAPVPQTPTTVDAAGITGLACVSASRCVAVDVNGGEVTFDPAAPGGAVDTLIDPGQILYAVSCAPGSSTCTAVDGGGTAVTFDPAAPAPATRIQVDANHVLTAVSCPPQGVAPQPMCAAIDTAGNEVQFDPGTQGHQSLFSISGSGSNAPALTAIACADANACLVFDTGGTATIANSSGTSSTVIDQGHAILAADCATASQCTVVDNTGAEVTFAPGTYGSSAKRTAISSQAALSAVSCPAATRCVAVDDFGHALTFDPQAPPAVSSALVDSMPALSALACPSATQCTAADESGDEVTFDPASATVLGSASLHPGAVIYGIACPSQAQCTAVDGSGAEVTFNPGSPSGATPVAIVHGHPLLAIACPSATQCTAVDDDQYEVTFNPQVPTSGRYALLRTPAGVSITGIACPSSTQCTAVDGAGDQVTFDPQNPGQPKPTLVLSAGAVGVSCPETDQCTALGVSGERATFDPLAPSAVTDATLEAGRLDAVTCPTGTYCLAVDAAGRAVEFDPHGAGAAAVSTVAAGVPASAVACVSAGDCVAVDTAGAGFVGTGSIPAPPAGMRAPRILGRPRQGETLTEVHGSWSGTPTSYALQWERCGRSGACRPVPGATGPSYRLGQRDIGKRMRVVEEAANAGGRGGALASSRTRPVSGRPAAPRFAGVALRGLEHGRPELSLSVREDRWGPLLRTVRIVLPKGLRVVAETVSRDRRRGLLALHTSGRRVRFRVHVKGRTVLIRLAPGVARVRLMIRSPALGASSALVRAARRHRLARLRMDGTLAVRDGKKLHFIVRFSPRV